MSKRFLISESEITDIKKMYGILNEDNFSFLENLLDTDYLFINFPPSKFKNYLLFLNKIYTNKNLQKIEKIIFI